MEFGALRAGSLIGREVERRRRLLLEDQGGQPVGSVALKRVPAGLATVLDAAGATFAVHLQEGEGFRGPQRWAITDGAGAPVGQMVGERAERVLSLPAGELTWSHEKRRRPPYFIDGLYSANRKGAHQIVGFLSHKVFTADVTEGLVSRPDASLVTLLAAWLTHVHISAQVASAAQSGA